MTKPIFFIGSALAGAISAIVSGGHCFTSPKHFMIFIAFWLVWVICDLIWVLLKK
jgi:hypothetical protein